MVIPNFFIIGAPKCGTTALSEYLRDHPSVFVSIPKEPHFFAKDFDRFRRVKNWDDYQDLFRSVNHKHIVAGEASVWYLYSAIAVKEIYHFNSKAKLIILLRNPVDMLISLHAQLIFTFFEDQEDFELAWRLQPKRAEGSDIPSTCLEPSFLQYRQVGRLGYQLDRVLSVYPENQVKIILYEDFAHNTSQVYEDVLEFLNVPSDRRTEFPQINVRRKHNLKWVGRLMYYPPFPLNLLERSLKNWRKRQGKNRLEMWHRIMAMNAKPVLKEPISSELRSELESEFNEDIQHLSQILDRDLGFWFS
jgi:hypothetical protein